MMQRLRKILRMENAGLLSASVGIQIVGYAISLALTPLAIAFYTPAEFGKLAVVLYVANFVGGYGGLRLEWAVINEHSRRIADLLMRFAATLLLLWGAALFAVALLAPSELYNLLAIERGQAMMAAPIAVAIGLGIFQQSWGIREQAYRDVYLSRNVVMVSRQVLQIAFGMILPSVLMLLVTELAARVLGILVIVRRLGKPLEVLPLGRFLKQAKAALLRRYGHYTKVALPSSIVDFAQSESLPVILLLTHGPEVGGAFWLVQRIFGLPVALIGTVVGDVFQGQMARQRDRSVIVKQLSQTAALLTLFAVVLLPAVAVAFWFLTQNLYNGTWALSGEIGLYLVPAICLQFIASPLSRSLIVLKRMQYKYVFDGALFLALASWLAATQILGLSLMQSMIFLSIAQSIAYSIYIFLSFYVAKLK